MGLPGDLGSHLSFWAEVGFPGIRGFCADAGRNPADKRSRLEGTGHHTVTAGVRRGAPLSLRPSGWGAAIHFSSVAEGRGPLRGLCSGTSFPGKQDSHPVLTVGGCWPSQSERRPPPSTPGHRRLLPWLFHIGRTPLSCLTFPCSRGWLETSSSICWSSFLEKRICSLRLIL